MSTDVKVTCYDCGQEYEQPLADGRAPVLCGACGSDEIKVRPTVCPTCDNEGFYEVCGNGDPDNCYNIACDCEAGDALIANAPPDDYGWDDGEQGR
jgi:hypothetical protein